MNKKRASSSSPSLRPQLWLLSQLVVSLSVIACILAVLKIQSQAISLPAPLVVFRSEEVFAGTPKVAFLFLARANLPLDFIWHTFFQNAEEGNFSIYIHSKPGFVFDETTTRSNYFLGRQIERSIQVAWGEASMIEAERILLGTALENLANQRFVLLSDSCVPLYNFSYTYNYLMSSSKSFVDSFLNKKEGRYNPKMSPTIPKDKWRKGSQWITLVRRHVAVIVDDNTVFPVFQRHCKTSSHAEHVHGIINEEIMQDNEAKMNNESRVEESEGGEADSSSSQQQQQQKSSSINSRKAAEK